MVRQKTVSIRQFIIESVGQHPRDIAAFASNTLKLSRQAVNKHLKEMCENGVLVPQGNTKSRSYALRCLAVFSDSLPTSGLEEDIPWDQKIRPLLGDMPANILAICQYGFTEMLNNAIDHSEAEMVTIECLCTAESIRLTIADQGVGIFKKIQKSLNLNDEREAILELVKGKFTTDPVHHTGEGVFFTSRMVDTFSIWSGKLFFTHIRPNDDWLTEVERDEVVGTRINLVVSMNSKLAIKDVFDQYATPDDFLFSRTHVPIRLAQFGTDNLVSRSQAKRVLSRFQRFSEVLLDFAGVDFIGQAFADEIFRVFQSAHPEIKLISINTNKSVAGMINRAVLAARE